MLASIFLLVISLEVGVYLLMLSEDALTWTETIIIFNGKPY